MSGQTTKYMYISLTPQRNAFSTLPNNRVKYGASTTLHVVEVGQSLGHLSHARLRKCFTPNQPFDFRSRKNTYRNTRAAPRRKIL